MDAPLAAPGRQTLRGRADECALLDGLLDDLRRGASRSLVLRGEAGIGKTALLRGLIGSAADLTVVRAEGVESEMELAFAGLHQLCAPLLQWIDPLPAPQREALAIVFGRSAGAAPDRFLVGLGVLSLLSGAAEGRPLLCVIDDAQWLDRASALTLAFVARRLVADPVGIVFAVRESVDDFDDLPELELQGLRGRAARSLLGASPRFMLDERVRNRIMAEARGNPLALLELSREMTPTQLAGGFTLPAERGLAGAIEERFVARIEPLPDDTKHLLLVAAAEPVGDPLLLWRAARSLGIAPAAAGPAEADGLVAIDERVIFRHPLVRSAIYRSAGVANRRAAHLALAEVSDAAMDPDRRAWHLAAAAPGPSEAVAAELERSAGRAQGRSGLAAAAAFLQRAVGLTLDSTRRRERALAAAQVSVQAGDFQAALNLVETAEAGSLDDFQRARAALLRGHVAFGSGASGDAPGLLLDAARRLEPFDPALARETYLNAWGSASITAHLDQGCSLLAVSRAIRAVPSPPGDPGALELLLGGLSLLTTDGHAAAAPTLRRAAEALADIPVDDVLRWGWAAASASTAVWDDDGLLTISARQVQLVRAAGELAQLPIHLSTLAHARAWIGDFRGAASLIAELDSVTAATGSHVPPYALLKLSALQGKEPAASAAIATAIEQGFPHGYLAAAVLYNGLGHYEDAAFAARQAAEASFEPWAYVWALPELVEAAVRRGETGGARDALERLVATTQPCGSSWALGIEARCRALLSSDAAVADELYREAIERLTRTRLRPEIARSHLLYGEWLRCENRRIDARAELRIAHELFSTMGMEAFAERACKELMATGDRVVKRAVDAHDDLTTQEFQIAQLARKGLSNPEIGARLFLSPRTVEWHLRKIFAKLGIRSRRDLADALPTLEHELAPA